MNFDLPADVEQLRRTVRKFVDETVIPSERAIERDNAVPESVRREAGRLGLFGITIPEEYGGSGLGALARSIVHQELGRAGLGSICSIVGAHTGIGTIGIVRTGSRYLREKYLPPSRPARRSRPTPSPSRTPARTWPGWRRGPSGAATGLSSTG